MMNGRIREESGTATDCVNTRTCTNFGISSSCATKLAVWPFRFGSNTGNVHPLDILQDFLDVCSLVIQQALKNDPRMFIVYSCELRFLGPVILVTLIPDTDLNVMYWQSMN
jgi:hypothetical protein